jgi:hypothetical protein
MGQREQRVTCLRITAWPSAGVSAAAARVAVRATEARRLSIVVEMPRQARRRRLCSIRQSALKSCRGAALAQLHAEQAL